LGIWLGSIRMRGPASDGPVECGGAGMWFAGCGMDGMDGMEGWVCGVMVWWV
jgi:hypothetical protein